MWVSEFRASQIKYFAIDRRNVANDRSMPAQNYLPNGFRKGKVVKLVISNRSNLFDDNKTFLGMDRGNSIENYCLLNMESFCAVGTENQVYGPHSLPENERLLFGFANRSRFVNENNDIDEIFLKEKVSNKLRSPPNPRKRKDRSEIQ